MIENARLMAGVFILLALNGCALVVPQTMELREAWPAALPDATELTGVPFFRDDGFLCGPSSLATTLVYAGVQVTPDDLVPQVYLPGRRGSLQVEMLAAPRKRGIVSYALEPRFEDVLREIAAGNPVIVLQDFGTWPIGVWHYAVAVGYDRGPNRIYLRSGDKQRLDAPFAAFEYTWRPDDWAMVTMPPDRVPVTATEPRYLEALAAMARVADARSVATAYRAFLARWPDNLTAHIGLANALYGQGDLRETESVLRDAIARHPDSPVALNNLAQAISDEGRNDEALTLVDKAAAMPGDFATAVRETRELILRRLGRK